MGNEQSAGEQDGDAIGWRSIPKRLRAVVKPWRAHFKQMDGILAPFVPHGVSDWVHVDLGVDSTRRNWRENVLRCRETLELLSIVAIVKHASDADTSTPQEQCDGSAGASVLACHGTSRRYMINCYNRKPIARVTDVEVFKEFFFAFDGESSLRDEFRNALSEIYSQLTPEMQQTVEKHRRIPVTLFMSNTRFGPGLSVAHLTSAMELVKGIGERTKQANALATSAEGNNGQWRYRFPFTDTIARLHISPCILEYGAAPILSELIALGVEINEEISIANCSALGRLPISKLGPVLNAITDVSSLRESEGYEMILRRGEWESLLFMHWWPAGAWHARVIQAVCSSLAVCKDFAELHLSYFGTGTVSSRKSRRKILQWLAYALFSKDSTTDITALTIDKADFQDADVAAIMAVILTDNPAKELLDGDSFLWNDEAADSGGKEEELGGGKTKVSYSTEENHGSDDDEDPGFACLKAGTTITTKPVDDEEQLGSDPESLVLKQDGRFRVMRNDTNSDWVDIIVPHYGYCVILRAAIDQFEPAAASKRSSADYSGSITLLILRDANHQVLLPLIDFIGPKLLTLEIHVRCSEMITTSDFLRHLLSGCPSLESIKLGETDSTSVSVFMEVYESGNCKIESLSLYDLKAEHRESIVALARMLQDPDSAAAKTLRTLQLRARPHQLFDESVFKALAEMLQVNRTIEFLEIDMSESLKEEHKPSLKRTKGQRVIDRPLELACQHAFLSVLRHHARTSSTTEPPRKRVRLDVEAHDTDKRTIFDHTVIASIFAFAAKRGTRQIRINTAYAP